MKRTFKLGWFILIIGLLLLVLGKIMHGSKEVSFDNWKPKVEQYATTVSKKYTKIGRFTKIDVRTTEADIEIVQGNKYAVEYVGRSNNKPSVKVEKEKLIVKQAESGFNEFHLGFSYNDDSDDVGRIVISVPQNISLNELDAKSGGGDVKVDDQKINSLKLSSSDGDIAFTQATVAKARIDVADGDVAFNEVHLGSGTISQNDGDLVMKNGELKQVEARNQDGDVSYTETTLNGGRLEMQDGDFTAKQVKVRGSYSVSNSDGDNSVENSQVGGYRLTTSDGNNRLFERSSESDLTWNSKTTDILKLSTIDGDNEVK